MTIFTFWEPRGAVIPYIALCMETWKRALQAYDVVVLDHENLPRYAGPADLDLEMLRRVPPNVQKDAVMVAVLRGHGGVFIDADTLAVRDIAPLLGPLDRTELVMLYPHLAFMAARPGARLLDPWLSAIQRRLAELRHLDAAPPEVPWGFLGNDILYPVMDHMIDAGARPPFVLATAERALGLARRLAAPEARRPRLARLVYGILWRRRIAYFRTIHRERLTMLDRDRHAFMPERFDRRPTSTAAEGYRRYWFESDGDGVLREGQILPALTDAPATARPVTRRGRVRSPGGRR